MKQHNLLKQKKKKNLQPVEVVIVFSVSSDAHTKWRDGGVSANLHDNFDLSGLGKNKVVDLASFYGCHCGLV